MIYASMRRSRQPVDASIKDASQLNRRPKSFERASSWLPESGFRKAPILERCDGGESALRNLASGTLPGVRENGDSWDTKIEWSQGSAAC